MSWPQSQTSPRISAMAPTGTVRTSLFVRKASA